MSKSKKVKKDKGELLEETKVEEAAKPKRIRAPAIVITDEAFKAALDEAGGEAKITPLYEKFDKTDYADIPAPKLKTALRKKGLTLAKTGAVKAVHEEGKKSYIFQTA